MSPKAQEYLLSLSELEAARPLGPERELECAEKLDLLWHELSEAEREAVEQKLAGGIKC